MGGFERVGGDDTMQCGIGEGNNYIHGGGDQVNGAVTLADRASADGFDTADYSNAQQCMMQGLLTGRIRLI